VTQALPTIIEQVQIFLDISWTLAQSVFERVQLSRMEPSRKLEASRARILDAAFDLFGRQPLRSKILELIVLENGGKDHA